ncbi:MAG: MerR family transcriptional regulator [Hyphomicrobiales bacterium]|nr:MerR family transcriptional regulator [Hyphomicrobiales bacterium]
MVNDSEKSQDAFRTISEVAEALALPQHVLRFWETRFSQIKPLKRGGGRRYYRPEDVELVRAIQHLLYQEGYTIKGVQRILKEKGLRAVIAASGAMRQEGRLKMFSGEMAVAPRDDDADDAMPQGGGFEGLGLDQLEAFAREIDACASLLEAARLQNSDAG